MHLYVKKRVLLLANKYAGSSRIFIHNTEEQSMKGFPSGGGGGGGAKESSSRAARTANKR